MLTTHRKLKGGKKGKKEGVEEERKKKRPKNMVQIKLSVIGKWRLECSIFSYVYYMCYIIIKYTTTWTLITPGLECYLPKVCT